MESEYKVRLEAFEGPLDLLLYLVKKDEVDIYDISIERITQQYLSYLETFEVLHIEVAGEFLVMARRPHRHADRTRIDPDLQRFFRRESVGRRDRCAAGLPSDDAGHVGHATARRQQRERFGSVMIWKAGR